MSRDELSPSEAARRIGATTRSVQRWIAIGRLPARRVGGRWRVASDVIDAFAVSATAPAVPTDSPAPIRTLFIANRGEIVTRIARTATHLGIRPIAPTTDGDAALDLLDAQAVVDAARTAGADAVHPGFGFLAESADFAERVIAAGIRWVGPPPSAIREMGDKAAARTLAARLGIPILPGYDEADQSDDALIAAARRIGAPLLVKPAAGGGGKGMRLVNDLADLPTAIAGARREARTAFGDDRLILERFLRGPRHIEVQVLFDGHGHGVHLGERDCSIQRRHQKILEESPSPAVDDALRATLGDRALALARAVGYVSAGTCEFLLADDGTAVFLEMNTRLQVEHPVTEEVTGRDLVADQLRIAAGEPLGFDQAAADAARAGTARPAHAVEVRLYAEDADEGFLPATGRVEALSWPSGDGIRIDPGIEPGDEVTGRFDPMLAKIIASGTDRGAALDRLAEALDATVVLGLTTNLRFLRWLVRQPVVRAGEARIDTLERIWPPEDHDALRAIPDEAWQAAATALADRAGWRFASAPLIRLAAEGAERSLATRPPPRPPVNIRADDDTVHVDVDGRSVAFRQAAPPDTDRAMRRAMTHAQDGGPVEIAAPMPGAVRTVHVAAGDTVDAGDPLVTLEAMKMEHAMAAPIAGRVTEVRVRPDDQVVRGQVVAIVEP
jgi:acetyl-CoA/propionyl-CoA carboxylase biotin carboxyl carrier protein